MEFGCKRILYRMSGKARVKKRNQLQPSLDGKCSIFHLIFFFFSISSSVETSFYLSGAFPRLSPPNCTVPCHCSGNMIQRNFVYVRRQAAAADATSWIYLHKSFSHLLICSKFIFDDCISLGAIHVDVVVAVVCNLRVSILKGARYSWRMD